MTLGELEQRMTVGEYVLHYAAAVLDYREREKARQQATRRKGRL